MIPGIGPKTLRARTLALAVALAASTAPAQQSDYEPQIGQPGKDVVWVPTPEALFERMLAMAQVGPGDVVFDLGSGAGRTVIAAAKRGARAVGVEYNPDLVALSRRNAERERLPDDRARFVEGDIFDTDFSSATVVTLYLLPDLNLRLRPTLLGMRAGTRIVSHMFKMQDWNPDETSYLGQTPAYLWIVPANGDIAGASVELPRTDDYENRLRDGLGPVRERFAYTLLDCPPSLGPVTVNALVAADRVIVPVQAEYLALEGMVQFLDTLKLIRRELNPDLDLAGVVITMHDERTRLSHDVERELRQHLPAPVFKTVIPRSIRVAEAAADELLSQVLIQLFRFRAPLG